MINIGIYGTSFSASFNGSVRKMIQLFEQHKARILVYDSFAPFLIKCTGIQNSFETFNEKNLKKKDLSVLISIGGDGTLLSTIAIVRETGIPVLGVNTGRLGFLASLSFDDIRLVVKDILNKNYILEKRGLLKLDSRKKLFSNFNYALNELTVTKKNTSMITINTYVDGEYLNSYWADGLIVATPTGSTAYSLSCGGPIITPESESFIVTPISSHNLTMRPIVIPDKHTIKLTVSDERQSEFLVSLDSRTATFKKSDELMISKADFSLYLVKLKNENFFSTIRNKLMWGHDKRN